MIRRNNLPGVCYLNPILLGELLKHYPVRTFLTESEIIYKGHIPNAAYICVEGTFAMSKKKAVVTLLPGTMVGARELYRKNIFRFHTSVSSGGKAIIIDRTTLEEALHHQDVSIRNSFLAAIK